MMEDVGDRALGGAVEPVGGAFALLRHAHVERAVGLKGKAACPAIDLHRRYADVEDDAVDRLDAALREQSVDLTEAAADQGEATVRFGDQRSDEHTSELQSLMRISYAVFCLKTKKQRTTTTLKKSTNKHKTKTAT